MAYMALYRKWRPMIFDEVVEQRPVVTVLRNAVISGRIAHAYLFCGTRGTGKTTMAKIFARAVNCQNPQNGNPCNECDVCRSILTQQILDVSEIDAASNNGVDNIRSIIEETAYASSVARYKVFIIDEVHMLSTGAFNALLKTLEEPPQNVIFILATTEPNKLPVTILSRCQRYDFKRISQEGIIERLKLICEDQKIEYEIPALAFLAQKSDGAMRDAISLLDQTLASCEGRITLSSARASTGSIDKEFIERFALNIIKADGADILRQISFLFSEGRDPSDFIAELMQIYRNVLVIITVKNTEGLLYETNDSMALLKEIASRTSKEEITLMIKGLSKLDSSLKWAVQRKIMFEAGILSLCDRKWDESESSLTERITALEKRMSDIVNAGLSINKLSSQAEQQAVKQDYKIAAKTDDIVKEKQTQVTQDTRRKAEISDLPYKSEAADITPEVSDMKKQDTSSVPGKITYSDELDWKDFLSNISNKGQASLSALIKINSKGALDGKGNLILVFTSPIVKDMIIKKEATDILSESATMAYGKPLRVLYAVKNDDLTSFAPFNIPETADVNIKESKKDSFDEAVDILNAISAQDGFTVEQEK